MSETPFSTSVGEWLRAAHAGEGSCPPPELYLEEAEGRLAPAEREALARHAADCPACAGERLLARSFAVAPREPGVDAEDVRFVVEHLRQNAPVRAAAPAAGRLVAFPAIPRAPSLLRSAAVWRWAAVVLLALAAGLAWRWVGGAGGALPAPELAGTVRGAEVEGLAPAGEVAVIPAELDWEPYRGAASYRMRLTAVDGAVLWQGSVAAPPARLPADLLGRLHPAVRYTWTVIALGPDGAEIAAAEPVSFRGRPR